MREYTPATSISLDGRPTGYSSWEFYLKAINEYKDFPGAHWAKNRTEDRIREAKEVINKTYIKCYKNFAYCQYIWSWQIESEEEKKFLCFKTLGFIKYIIKNHQTLKPNHIFWDFFSRHFYSLEAKYSPYSYKNKEVLPSINKHLKKYDLEIIFSKAAPYTYALSKDFDYYYYLHTTVIEFFTEKDIEFIKRYQVKGSMNLDNSPSSFIKVDKNYYHASCLINLGKGQEVLNKKLHNICPICNHIKYIKDLILNSRTETCICKNCNTNLKNTKISNEDNILGGYHSHSNWKFLIARLENENTIPMGIEIEMHPTKGNIKTLLYNLYKKQQKFNSEWDEFYFENDGSLAPGGVECITNPMTLKFAQHFWKLMLPEFRKNFVGWKSHIANFLCGNNYGIHITTNRNRWSNIQLARIIKFINSENNKVFMWAIAQRNNIYNSTGLSSYKNLHLNNLNYARTKEGKLIASNNRYTAVNLKSKLVEFRFFSSTLNQESFLKNYEFIDALWHWSKETSYSIEYKDFLEWLTTNKRTYLDYPNLFSYLHRDKFFIKTKQGSNIKPIKNVFLKDLKTMSTSKFILTPPAVVDPDSLLEDSDYVPNN